MFKDKLRELRKDSNYSMDAFCELYNKKFNAKMNKSTLSRYENGLQEPMFSVVKNIANIFNVTTDYLTSEETNNVTVRDEHDNVIVLDDETLEIIDSLRSRPDMKMLFSVSKKATPEDIIQAVKIIEALKKDSE